ncbi:MAG: hypothetical protein H0T66_12860 [Geodermatophilaceae bacterium]|nr:hypothetical protein [Geodermatophilaceae bacterium]MDQ3455243.1 hypothetical protein [Actinomycetota bacterium]
MLGQLDSAADGVVIADFEAGLGTVIRMGDEPVDVVVLVTEPTVKSLEVARRAADLVHRQQLGRLVVTANRLRDDEDLSRVRAAFPGIEVVIIPDEPAIVAAERRGVAPFDAAPDSPGVRALVALADSLGPACSGRG